MLNPFPMIKQFAKAKGLLANFWSALLIMIPASTWSQELEDFPGFGNFSKEEVTLKQVDFDKDANAVILHDLARSQFNEDHHLVTEHRVRIKILNEKGIDRANIVIPYYSRDNFEYITGVEAIIKTFEPNGLSTTENLSRKNIYNKKMDEFYSETRFTLPNVKAGSIFEYVYFSNKKSYSGLEDWNFQSDLPTLTSFYKLAILPNAEFTYKVYKLPTLPIEINNKTTGWVCFQMNNIPALHDEAYMDSRRDNLQRVTFQLSAFNVSGFKEKYINKWEDAAKELLHTPELGGQLNRTLAGTEEFIKATRAIPDEYERLKKVYAFVQQKMSWNGYNSKYTVDGIKKAWEKGSGTNGEINLAFINLLYQVNITACPLLANNRERGKIDINYPFIDQFAKLVTYVSLRGKPLVIDAADRSTPIHMVPYSLLNTYGYKIDKKDKGLLLLEDNQSYEANVIFINASLSPEGILSGSVLNQSLEYARLRRVSQFKKLDTPKYMERYFTANLTNLKADSLGVKNLEKDSLPLDQTFRFTQTLNTSGDYAFLNYHLFTNLEKNPFISNLRFSDINFGSPQRLIVSQIINLPDNYSVDAIPKNLKMITPDTAFALLRNIKVENGQLLIQFKLEINRSFFEREEYHLLQAFYKKMFGLLDEQIVLKRKS